MLVGDALIVCSSKKERMTPIKILCLSGLTVKGVKGCEGFGMEVGHRGECYSRSVFYFESENIQIEWLNVLKVFEGDSLHKNFWIEEVIGTGKFSVVYRCIDKSNEKVYALKAI